MRTRRILVIVHELYTTRMLRTQSQEPFDTSFYRKAEWASRPNSTQRLSVVNLQALRELQKEFDIEIRTDREWSPEIEELYLSYDVIVVNTVSSRVSEQFIRQLLNWKRAIGSRAPQLILGTEMTWRGRLEGGSITEQDFRDIHFNHLLLRHTGRTDAHFYSDDSCHDLRIQEFEVGIDFGALPAAKPIEERKRISVVRAPAGRSTKNNEAIDSLLDSVRANPFLKGFETREINPPYSTTDYWDLMAGSTFLLFTSLGETFSYALNDAKALGVVTLYPEVMYRTRIGYRFAVDSYPGSRIRYRDTIHALDLLSQLAADKKRLKEESRLSTEYAERHFSLRRVTDNWRVLLSGKNLNTAGLYIYGASVGSWSEVASRAASAGCTLALPLHNAGPLGKSEEMTWIDPISGVLRVLDYATATADGALERVLTPTLSGGSVGPPLVKDQHLSDGAHYLQLVCRLNKVARIVPGSSLGSNTQLVALGAIKSYEGLNRGLRPIPVEWERV